MKKDLPTSRERRDMWKNIRAGILPQHSPRWFGFERRSFVFGFASAVVAVFTCVGIAVSIRQVIDLSRPEPVRIGAAYESAIRQFERVAPVLQTAAASSDMLASRQEQLRNLDKAITDLKHEMNGGDISPSKMTRLRQLYSRKLRLLQEMVEQGEIEL